MEMLFYKEVPCFENLRLAYCVNKRNIPDYCCQRSAFFMTVALIRGIFGGVARVKRFVNVHLHCIVSNLKRICTTSTLAFP